MSTNKINLKDLTHDGLEQFMLTLGEKKFRAKQVYKWIYEGVESIGGMTDISKDLRETLKEKCYISSLKIQQKQTSASDETTKYLFRLEDGNLIESVLMKYKYGWSICISTQVGCRMGCRFCASTVNGLVRNLTPGEMLDQIMTAQKDLDIRISNVVLMGIGEPLDNYDSVLKFIQNANHPHGLNIGGRHISLSTCGLADKIRDLADKQLQISLSVSLHAVDDRTRTGIMPINNKYNINEVINACKYYMEKNNRRISFEYTLIEGVNDSLRDAQRLAALLRGIICYVNVISVNEVTGASYRQLTREKVEAFANTVTAHGVKATIRRELGSDIDAACGQLRNKEVNECQ